MRILLDMDGVLCDFHSAVCRIYDKQPWPFVWTPNQWNWFGEWGVTDADLAPHMNRSFYAGLDWTPDGREILDRAEQKADGDVWLVTSPWDTDGCMDGKRDWVRTHMPKYARRMLIGSPKELCSHPGVVLLDDSEKNCRAFVKTQFPGHQPGHAVLLPRPWNVRHDECDFNTGRVWDLAGLFCGYTDGRPSQMDQYLESKKNGG